MVASPQVLSPTETDAISRLVGDLHTAYRSRKTRPIQWRLAQLERAKDMFRERDREIAEALEADLGKCYYESWLGEINFCANEADHAIKHLASWMEPESASTPLALQPGSCKVYREPLGVSLIIGAWNYPFQLVAGPLIGALAAGNCVVLKPSEISQHSSRLLADLIPQYLDTECIKVQEGGIPETTALLEQRFDHIFYTGNGTVGRIVMRAAAEHLTPVTLELGGKSPCIVDEYVDLDVAARRICWGKFFNAGQTCVAPDYVLAHANIIDALTAKLKTTLVEFYGSDPKSSDDYGRIVNERHFDRILKLVEDDKVIVGGQHDRSQRYISPTLLRDVDPNSPLMSEEIFGPVLPILSVPSIGSAIDFINERDKPLALYLFSKDRAVQKQVLAQTSSGGACINDATAHLGVADLPFGGVGESGMGAYHGQTGFETFSHRKGVLNKSNKFDVPLRYPPYSDKKLKWARRLI